MSTVSVDNIQPIGSGTTVTVNKSVTLESGNTNITGVCTATSFVGSGANLTSLPAQATIANNADNRVITGGSGVNLNGEANLTWNGSKLLVGATSSHAGNLVVKSSDSSSNQVWIIGRSSDNTGSVSFRNNADDAYVRAPYIGSGNVTISGIALVQVQLFQPPFTQVWII